MLFFTLAHESAPTKCEVKLLFVLDMSYFYFLSIDELKASAKGCFCCIRILSFNITEHCSLLKTDRIYCKK